MKILIDTNVIMDVLEMRHPHYADSANALEISAAQKSGHITVGQTNDIFYLLNKYLRRKFGDGRKTKQVIIDLLEDMTLLPMFPIDAKTALASNMPDYEDALLAHCAARGGMDYIITRNIKDFVNSPIPAITPKDFCELISERGGL